MINTLKKIPNRLYGLSGIRTMDLDNSQIYRVFVEPTFVELREIHDDYVAIFETVIRRLKSGASLEEVIIDLEATQSKFEPVRSILDVALVEVSLAFREKLIPHWAESFFRAVIYYFPTGRLSISEGTIWASLLEVLNAIKDDDISQIRDAYWRHELAGKSAEECIYLFLDSLKGRWREVCRCYGVAQAEQIG